MVSTGGLALSRVSNRFDVNVGFSSPNTSQPKLPARVIQPRSCTSATICGELHVYCPMTLTDWLALTVAEKSPPSLVQKIVSKKRCRHVASLGVAGAPSPSSPDAMDVPSPQSASSLCSSTGRARIRGVLRHVHAEGHGCYRRAGRNVSSNVECKHAAAKFTHGRSRRRRSESQGRCWYRHQRDRTRRVCCPCWGFILIIAAIAELATMLPIVRLQVLRRVMS